MCDRNVKVCLDSTVTLSEVISSSMRVLVALISDIDRNQTPYKSRIIEIEVVRNAAALIPQLVVYIKSPTARVSLKEASIDFHSICKVIPQEVQTARY